MYQLIHFENVFRLLYLDQQAPSDREHFPENSADTCQFFLMSFAVAPVNAGLVKATSDSHGAAEVYSCASGLPKCTAMHCGSDEG